MLKTSKRMEDQHYLDWFDNLREDERLVFVKFNYDITQSVSGFKNENYQKIIDNTNLQWKNKLEEITKQLKNTIKDQQNEIQRLDSHSKSVEGLKNDNYQKILDNTNLQWKIKLEETTKELKNTIKEQENEIKRLDSSYNSLKKDNYEDIKKLVSNMEEKINMFTNSNKKGKINETRILDLLLNLFNESYVKSVANKRGQGDIYMEHRGIRFMIECKMQKSEILDSDPAKIFDRFQQDSIDAINGDVVDIGIFIANGVKYIPKYGYFKAKQIQTNKGKSYLIYLADVFNYPERVNAAVELAVQLINNTDKFDKETWTKINTLNDKILNLNNNMKLWKTNINQQIDILKNTVGTIGLYEDEFNIILNTNNQNELKVVLDTYHEIFMKNKNVTTVQLSTELEKKGMIKTIVRKYGGLSKVKHLYDIEYSKTNHKVNNY